MSVPAITTVVAPNTLSRAVVDASVAIKWFVPDDTWHSQALNFHDALIALACREREIPVIASFDPDFDLNPWLNRLTSSS